MKVHEYQARELLDKAGIPVPAGSMVQTAHALTPEALVAAYALTTI